MDANERNALRNKVSQVNQEFMDLVDEWMKNRSPQLEIDLFKKHEEMEDLNKKYRDEIYPKK